MVMRGERMFLKICVLVKMEVEVLVDYVFGCLLAILKSLIVNAVVRIVFWLYFWLEDMILKEFYIGILFGKDLFFGKDMESFFE